MHTLSTINTGTIAELSPSLLAAARRALPSSADAEDLVQDAWLSALRSQRQFEGRSALKTWVMTILRRRIADFYRRRRPSLPLQDSHLHTQDPADPHKSLAHQQLAQLARQAMPQLSPLEREAVQACDVEGAEREETLDRLGISAVHLRVLLHRGRRKLKLHLETQGVLNLAAAA